MFTNILKAFVIGSSWFVFVPFFIVVSGYHKKKTINFSYYCYSLLAPLWFGIWSAIAALISTKMRINPTVTFLGVSIISPLIIASLITIFPIYDWNTKNQLKHNISLFMFHFLTFNAFIATLYKKI